MVFYFRIIRPFIYTNAMAYIRRRREYWNNNGGSDDDKNNNSNNTMDLPNQTDNANKSENKELTVGPN